MGAAAGGLAILCGADRIAGKGDTAYALRFGTDVL